MKSLPNLVKSSDAAPSTSTSVPAPPTEFTDRALALIADLQTKVGDWQQRQLQRGGAKPPRPVPRKPESASPSPRQLQPNPPSLRPSGRTPAQPASTAESSAKTHPTEVLAIGSASGTPASELRPSSVPDNTSRIPASRLYARQQVAVLIRPPPPVKLNPCFPTGYVKEMEPVEEKERLRQQYNRRPPWDKTPAWRPMTREEAADVYDGKGTGTSADSLSPLQQRVVKLAHTLSPSSNRSSLSPGLSDTERSMQSPGSGNWETLESLERTNASLLRPVGRNLLATHRYGELHLPTSPLRIAEYNKQIHGSNRPPVAECTVRNVARYQPLALSPRVQEELDRVEWEAQRRFQRRIVAVASKAIAEETTGADATGTPLSLFSAHRRHHEMQ